MTRPNEDQQPGANLMPNPDQVNEFHRYADTDNSPDSTHHTLGIDPNQASPGGHTHNGRDSNLISPDSHEHPETDALRDATGTTPTGNTVETTASGSYVNLTTVGPSATVIVGPSKRVMLILRMRSYSSVSGEACIMGVEVSGANTIAPATHDGDALWQRSPAAGGSVSNSLIRFMTLPNEGSTTFTAKYRVNAGTGSFMNRELVVVPL